MKYEVFSLLILVSCAVGSVTSHSLPSFLTQCTVTEAADGCVTEVAKRGLAQFVSGLPDLGVEPLDPLHVGLIDSKIAGLNIQYADAVIRNLGTADIKQFIIDTEKKRLKLRHVSDVFLKSPYTASGQILILPISGKGQITIRMKALDVVTTADIDEYTGTDGLKHIRIKNQKHKYTNAGAHFNLTNLFDGNKVLSDAMHNFLNNNWKEVSQEVGAPTVYAFANKILEIMNQFFSAVPLEKLFKQN